MFMGHTFDSEPAEEHVSKSAKGKPQSSSEKTNVKVVQESESTLLRWRRTVIGSEPYYDHDSPGQK